MDKSDFKTRCRSLYTSKDRSSRVLVPPMTFILLDGKGNPDDGKRGVIPALALLFAVTYAMKIRKKDSILPNDYSGYAVPPLGTLWWLAEEVRMDDPAFKEKFCWTTMIRQPDSVTPEVFAWACHDVEREMLPDADTSREDVLDWGLGVQCLHIGAYEDMETTIEKITRFLKENNPGNALSGVRRHHEIYISIIGRTGISNLKTGIGYQ